MKKIIAVLILGLAGLTSAFACESIFDSVEGMTCEIQYCLCRESNQDIKLCKRMKKKTKSFEKALKEHERKYQLLRVEANRLLNEYLNHLRNREELAKKADVYIGPDDKELKAFDDFEDASNKRYDEALKSITIWNSFFDEESEKAMDSALFQMEVLKLLEEHGIELDKAVEIQ